MNNEKARELTVKLAKVAFEEVKNEIDKIEKDIDSPEKGHYRMATVKTVCLLRYLKEGILKDMLEIAEDMLRKEED